MILITVNRTVSSAMEFHDSLHLQYANASPNLPTCCDGCCAKLSLKHALHSEVKDELIDVATQAFIPIAVPHCRSVEITLEELR